MKHIKYILQVFLLVCFVFACQNEDQEFGDLTAPSNIQVIMDIVGQDADNPNGDGSGVVNFTITANNALSYKIVFNNATQVIPNGSGSVIFSELGVNIYNVNIIAIGAGGNTSSKVVSVEVLSTYDPPAELKTLLYGFDPANPDALTSKTWRIKSESNGHFGLGPVGGSEPGQWFSAGAEEKSTTGMYDDRYVFTSDGTFKHITNSTNDDNGEDTTGTIFGRENPTVTDLGPTTESPNGADLENYPYEDYIEAWGLIGPNNIETITLTGLGFMGYYTGGDHTYEIFSRENPNEMILRTTDAASEFDWWFILTSE